jgi:hypothetical protein
MSAWHGRNVVAGYLTACFVKGDLVTAATYTTGETFQLTWYGNADIIVSVVQLSASHPVNPSIGCCVDNSRSSDRSRAVRRFRLSSERCFSW